MLIPDEWVERLERTFAEHSSPEIAERQSAYLLHHFPFFGLPKPRRVELQKELFQDYRLIDRATLLETVHRLWDKPQRELHYAGLDLLVKHGKKLEASDLELVENLLRIHAWWDSVDTLAAHVVGSLLLRHRSHVQEMDRWIHDDCLWVRRAALIFQLKWKTQTEEQRLFSYCEKRMEESNFFIRKAIGWALREYSKTSPESVAHFLTTHSSRLSPLSYKEASRLFLLS